jgi:glyoxylase-like metal-dependent hydrolase (beta-lactamase superfamily II)
MRRVVLLGAIAVLGLVGGWLLWPVSPRTLTIQRLSDRLFVITGGNDGNTAVFVRDQGVVLVDTRSEGNGQRILDLVRTVTDAPVTHIVNTHTHSDHVGSNAFFPGEVEVVVQENTAGQMPAMEEFGRPETRHGLPDRTFRDSLTLFSGSDAIDLRYFGAAHTNGDAFIVFRAAGVMHAGDTFPGVNVVARNGGSEAAYATTMSRAAAEITGVHTVIPGHGVVATWQEFVNNAAAIRARR